jgi:hypothetical protein
MFKKSKIGINNSSKERSAKIDSSRKHCSNYT